VKEIAETLKREGRKTRGDLGIAVQDLSSAMREAFKIPPNTAGVVLTEAFPFGPGVSAALKRGDVIVFFQEKAVRSAADFNRAVAQARPGSEVVLGLLRGGDRSSVKLTVADQLDLQEKQIARPGYALLGIRVKAVSSDLANTIGLTEPLGVDVEEVVPGSPADDVGIAPGDIIFQVGGTDVNDADQFRNSVGVAIQSQTSWSCCATARAEGRGTWRFPCNDCTPARRLQDAGSFPVVRMTYAARGVDDRDLLQGRIILGR